MGAAALLHWLCLVRGLAVYPGSGCADQGASGDLVMLGPPFNDTRAEINSMVQRLCQALLAMYDHVSAMSAIM